MKKIILISSTIFIILYLIPTLSITYFEKIYPEQEEKIEITQSLEEFQHVENSDSMFIDFYDVKRDTVVNIELEEYIKGVVAGEMPASFNMEALKAQAVTARTYLLYQLKKNTENPSQHPNAPICSGTHCQVYLSDEDLTERFSEKWHEDYSDKISEAVDSTKGEILTYDDKIIEPLFHSTSGGKTENSEDVFVAFSPYLRSVDSPYEEESPKLMTTISMEISEFIEILSGSLGTSGLNSQNLKDNIQLLEVSEGGKIMTLQIGEDIITGRDFRTMFNLNSASFKFVQNDDTIDIITTGYGHGVGMSQYGANGMAIEGYTYEEILKHYYTDVEIVQLK